ncbi:extracellular solute-binding protein [Halocella sp. SP3-1]|uniref:extracellular solute-binding protein n=1 Tax=Halocella sp. SP3-1 TaxID=2382161 RepID=UPI000F758D7F|nr:extracellular solute-binding protein [Halocella sp. SP3-1]AZO96252.1 extracellular solute-binding protein [Halocella sp. SP3-1]
MKKYRIVLLLLVLVISISCTVMAGELKEFDVFISMALPDYPGSTIIGDIIREETGVKLNREYLVGDLETKVGLMIASGEYPDMLVGAHFTDKFVDADVLIPLEDLIEEHAPNIKKYYARHMRSLTKEDGHIYYLPQQAIPYGAGERRYPAVGFFINKRVLKEAGYPVIKTFEQYFELIENYQKKHPTYKGQDTIGYLSLYDSWRNFATNNGPMHLIGYPNEGAFLPIKEAGKFVVRPYNGGFVEKYYYNKLNEMYNKGVVDPETFVINYDQYLEKISSGRVLGTHNQYWQIEKAQNILRQEDPDSIMVPFPVVYDEAVEEFVRDTPYVQTTQGMGITTACEDPVAAIKYLDYLVGHQILIQWGIKGEHYEVDENGMYYRTKEQQKLFDDPNWVRDKFGREYFYDAFPSLIGLDENGNNYMPRRQASMIYGGSTDSEKEVMDAYGIKSFTGLYNDPRPGEEVPYYPLWTITLETGSPAQIEKTRLEDTIREYVPKLVMSSPDEYEDIWEEYVARISKLMEKQIEVYQERIDWRVENWGSE